MFARICLAGFACVLFAFPVGPAADDKQVSQGVPETLISLRLNAIQTAKLLEAYEKYVQQEQELQLDLRVADPMDPRLTEYRKRIDIVATKLDTIKNKLITLETEKAKLIKRLPKEKLADEAPGSAARANLLLEKILERLGSIEKRLEKMERRQ